MMPEDQFHKGRFAGTYRSSHPAGKEMIKYDKTRIACKKEAMQRTQCISFFTQKIGECIVKPSYFLITKVPAIMS